MYETRYEIHNGMSKRELKRNLSDFSSDIEFVEGEKGDSSAAAEFLENHPSCHDLTAVRYRSEGQSKWLVQKNVDLDYEDWDEEW